MKYLCLIYDEEGKLDAMPQDEMDAFMGEYGEVAGRLAESGQLLAGEELQPVRTATTLRVRNGRMSTTDGPFAETREQLGGFFLLEARDLNEAIQLAAQIPSVRTGCVEVRPVREFAPE